MPHNNNACTVKLDEWSQNLRPGSRAAWPTPVFTTHSFLTHTDTPCIFPHTCRRSGTPKVAVAGLATPVPRDSPTPSRSPSPSPRCLGPNPDRPRTTSQRYAHAHSSVNRWGDPVTSAVSPGGALSARLMRSLEEEQESQSDKLTEQHSSLGLKVRGVVHAGGG